MEIILILVLAVIAIVSWRKNTEKREAEANTVPAEAPATLHFLRDFHAFCQKHKVVSTGVLINTAPIEGGNSEIKAYTQIYKVDGMAAAEAVDILRMAIAEAQNRYRAAHKDADPLELYHVKEKFILDFFGSEELTGNFWDVDECAYVDGKYIEFDAEDFIAKSLNQSAGKTLEHICATVRQTYPNAKIERKSATSVCIDFDE